MSILINLEKIDLAYSSSHPILENTNFQLKIGERVCLIGRNGAGKSSFLKLLDGSIKPDAGKIHYEPGFKIARLEQELPDQENITVYEVVSQAFNNFNGEDWQAEQLIQKILAQLDLIGSKKLSELSGGWQRRVALAKALVIEPDLLLLDEPTNHLDIEAIQWLEEQLLNFNGGILFITHDRWLLRRLATRIIELDRGQLTSWPGDYDNFLKRKEELLAAEANQNREFDKKLAKEEEWIRQGIKARRTRNEGRVRALKALRNERQQRREVVGKAKLEINQADQSGQLVIDAENISHSFGNDEGNQKIINQFSTRIMRGDRIGLLGPNGIGKTTLLNILLGKLAPENGKVKLGTKLDIAYFDQLRATLDPASSILDNLSGGRSSITINGKERHVISYLADFLFPAQQINMPVNTLSGGECNRLLLAKLFSLPANMLVMDEPTNDLDIETLELLEELLSQFSGTLLLVSHDRAFLDNIVTRTFAFEGNGKVGDYVGGYQDWLLQKPAETDLEKQKNNKRPEQLVNKAINQNATQASEAKTTGLDYNQRKELSKIPAKVEKLEQQQQKLFDQMAKDGFYDQAPSDIEKTTSKLESIKQELEQLYFRWEELENLA